MTEQDLYWQRYEKRWGIQGEMEAMRREAFIDDRYLVARCEVIHADSFLTSSIQELAARRRQMNCQCNGCRPRR